jgi:hypothetical protein
MEQAPARDTRTLLSLGLVVPMKLLALPLAQYAMVMALGKYEK